MLVQRVKLNDRKLYKMVKYLSVPMNDASSLESDGNQIIQVLDLIMCETDTTTRTIIDFAVIANPFCVNPLCR